MILLTINFLHVFFLFHFSIIFSYNCIPLKSIYINVPYVRLRILILYSYNSFFLFKISEASSLSFYNEFKNLALASYSYLSDSYSANKFVLKSAKSFAD